MNPPAPLDRSAGGGVRGQGSELLVAALLDTTRILVGVATRALEQLDADVSVPQFRLLLVLSELGATPSAQVAGRLGTVASSVTRLADHLEGAGHLSRHRGRPNRSVVSLELTASGRELVERVVGWRRAQLAEIVERLSAAEHAELTSALRLFCNATGSAYAVDLGVLAL